MNHKAALELRALINVESGTYLDVRDRVIGNGESVVLINSFFFIWCEEDWYKHRRKLLPVSKRVVKNRRKHVET